MLKVLISMYFFIQFHSQFKIISSLSLSNLMYLVNILTRISRIFVSLLVTFSYPLQIHPGRLCLSTLISSLFLDSNTNETTLSDNQKQNLWLIITVRLKDDFIQQPLQLIMIPFSPSISFSISLIYRFVFYFYHLF